MSCMVIDSKSLCTIGGIINALNFSGHALIVHSLQSFGARLKLEMNCQFLDHALIKAARLSYIINHKAYRSRYAPIAECRFVSPFFTQPKNLRRSEPFDSFESAKPLLFQTLKSLEYLQYQCIDLPRDQKEGKYKRFFEMLEQLIEIMKRIIVENTPEYKAAKWE